MNKLAKMMDLGDDGEGDIDYGDEEIWKLNEKNW